MPESPEDEVPRGTPSPCCLAHSCSHPEPLRNVALAFGADAQGDEHGAIAPLAPPSKRQSESATPLRESRLRANQIETASYAAFTSPAGVVPVPDATLVVTFGLGTTFDAPLDVVGSSTITRAAVYSL